MGVYLGQTKENVYSLCHAYLKIENEPVPLMVLALKSHF